MFTQNYDGLPSPKSGNQGYFYTLVKNSPQSGDDEIIASAIPSSVKLAVSPTDNEGVLKADIEFVGTGYEKGVTSGGIVKHADLANMYRWGSISAVKFGTANLTPDFISAEINITHGAKLAQDLPTGEVVFPKWEVTGTVKVIASPLSETMKSIVLSRDVNNAEELVIAFGSETPTAEGHLVLSSMCYLTEWKSDYTEGEVIEFQFEGVFTNSKYHSRRSSFITQ
jgi:hypothetical protein